MVNVRSGVVLSCASENVGPLVTLTDDPLGLAETIARVGSGVVAVPVWDSGYGFVSADGLSVDQILAEFR